jgi:hypothetical protein
MLGGERNTRQAGGGDDGGWRALAEGAACVRVTAGEVTRPPTWMSEYQIVGDSLDPVVQPYGQ